MMTKYSKKRTNNVMMDIRMEIDHDNLNLDSRDNLLRQDIDDPSMNLYENVASLPDVANVP